MTFVPHFENIEVDYAPGESREVTLHDGSKVMLKKLSEDYDPSDAFGALTVLHRTRDEGKFVTGILFVNPEKPAFDEEIALADAPLSSLTMDQARPPKRVLDEVMDALRTGDGATVSAGGG